MKKLTKRFPALLLTLVMIMGMSVTAFAAGTVTYNGNAEKFIFEPGSGYSPTDLFTDFKGVMPGDSITQKVQIKNDVSNHVKVKLYMRALGAAEGADFLSKLHLKVAQDGNAERFDAPANQTAQLDDWVYLGTFYSGAQVDLQVTLDVPIELGNDYQETIGYLDWQFKAEELPVEPSDPKAPQTGIPSHMGLWFTLVCTSGGAVIALGMHLGKKRNMTHTGG